MIPVWETYIDELSTLDDKKEDLAFKKQALIEPMYTKMAKLIDESNARVELSAKKAELIPLMEQQLEALNNVSDATDLLISAKKELLPKLNEKALKHTAYALEMQAWTIVKNLIAGVKEDIAVVRKEKTDRQSEIYTTKSDLQDAQLELKQAEILLRQAKITGQSDLMAQGVDNLGLLLAKRDEEFSEKLDRKGREFDVETDFDLWKAEEEYANMVAINDYAIPKEEDHIKGVAIARINKEGELAEIAANTKLTSQLVHLLT